MTSQQRYLPFGGERTDVGEISETDYGFTGQRNLDEGMGGLMDYKARFYSPYITRWTQPDTIVPDPANPQAWNRYSYALNNPIRYNDPSGHDADCGVGDSYCNDAKREYYSWRKHSKTSFKTFLRAKDAYEYYYRHPDKALKAFESQVAGKDGEITWEGADSYTWASIYSENVKHRFFEPVSDDLILREIDRARASGEEVQPYIIAMTFGLGIKEWMSDKYGSSGSVWQGKFPTTSNQKYLYRTDSTGNVTNFAVYDDIGDIIFRVDLAGRAHKDVPTPHIQHAIWDIDPATGSRHLRGWTDAVPWP